MGWVETTNQLEKDEKTSPSWGFRPWTQWVWIITKFGRTLVGPKKRCVLLTCFHPENLEGWPSYFCLGWSFWLEDEKGGTCLEGYICIFVYMRIYIYVCTYLSFSRVGHLPHKTFKEGVARSWIKSDFLMISGAQPLHTTRRFLTLLNTSYVNACSQMFDNHP